MSDFELLDRGAWLHLADGLYGRIERECAAFTPTQWERASPYLGWRVRDVLAHLTGAIRVNFRQMLDRALAGDPSPPAEFDTFARNAREVARARRNPIRDLLPAFRSELDALMGCYRRMSDADWLRPAWFFVGPVKVRDLFLVQMADTAFHERDILLPNARWSGLNPAEATVLADWFLREYRPANFRPDRAGWLSVTALYRLSGAGGGEWTMRVDGGRCTVTRGRSADPDVQIEAQLEDLLAAATARAAPVVGRLARRVDLIAGRSRAESVVAVITGISSLASGVLRRRIRVSGDRAAALRLQRAFWHFWERPRQTEENISLGMTASPTIP